MPEQQSSDELFHYGIKGMKWGVRRSDSQIAKAQERRKARRERVKKEVKETIKRPTTEDARNAGAKRSRAKKHGTDALSNDDLKKVVERMNLEQQYANLMDQKKSASLRSSGRRYVADILKDVGRDIATDLIKSGVKNAASRAAGAAAGGYSSWERPRTGPAAIGMIRKAIG